MSRDASVTLDWADGTYVFRLGWGELAKLQEACDAGPYVVLRRLESGAWNVADISNVIRLGLIGGSKEMEPVKALKLTRSWVEDRPPMENVLVARAVLSAACFGAPEEQIEKKLEAPDQDNGSTISQTGNSGSEPSMESAAS